MMSTKIKETVQALLTEGKIKGFLGLRQENGNITAAPLLRAKGA